MTGLVAAVCASFVASLPPKLCVTLALTLGRRIIAPNALAALLAAAVWGGGDFAGGMAAKNAGGGMAGALRVIILAHGVSLAAILCVLWATGARLPHGAPIVWALLAGVTAGLSLVAFYMSLASGAMGAAAALSGLLAAAIPAVVSSALDGRPRPVQALGFVVAGAAIWAIAAEENTSVARSTLVLAVLGGAGFGVYFVLLRLANPLGLLEPAALARTGSFTTCSLLLAIGAIRRKSGARSLGLETGRFSPAALRWSLGVALLDTSGNLLFLLATRLGRLDVASVLVSLYPAGTILLAALVLGERPSKRQLAGMVIALVAVVMVTA